MFKRTVFEIVYVRQPKPFSASLMRDYTVRPGWSHDAADKARASAIFHVNDDARAIYVYRVRAFTEEGAKRKVFGSTDFSAKFLPPVKVQPAPAPIERAVPSRVEQSVPPLLDTAQTRNLASDTVRREERVGRPGRRADDMPSGGGVVPGLLVGVALAAALDAGRDTVGVDVGISGGNDGGSFGGGFDAGSGE